MSWLHSHLSFFQYLLLLDTYYHNRISLRVTAEFIEGDVKMIPLCDEGRTGGLWYGSRTGKIKDHGSRI